MSTRWFVVLSLVLALFDQITKYIARAKLELGVRNEIIPDFFRLTLNFNKGIAWGMLPQWSEYFTYFAIIMVLVILMILKKLEKDEVWLKIALALQMAGAIGNMTDRLIRREVTDFLDVTLFPNTSFDYTLNLGFTKKHFYLPYDWPIFNLADSFVVIGTIVLVTVLAFSRDSYQRFEGETEDEQKDKSRRATFSSERSMGSVPMEEGLVEFSSSDTSEMLTPLEDMETVQEDQFGEDSRTETETAEDRNKLDELSKRPE